MNDDEVRNTVLLVGELEMQFSYRIMQKDYPPNLRDFFCFFSLTRNGAMRIRVFIVPTVCVYGTKIGQ